MTSALPVRVRQYWHCRKADINRERFLPLKPLHQLNLAGVIRPHDSESNVASVLRTL